MKKDCWNRWKNSISNKNVVSSKRESDWSQLIRTSLSTKKRMSIEMKKDCWNRWKNSISNKNVVSSRGKGLVKAYKNVTVKEEADVNRNEEGLLNRWKNSISNKNVVSSKRKRDWSQLIRMSLSTNKRMSIKMKKDVEIDGKTPYRIKTLCQVRGKGMVTAYKNITVKEKWMSIEWRRIVEIDGKTPYRIKTLCQVRGKGIGHSL